MESVIRRFEAEAIRRSGPWRGPEDVQFATLKRVRWFNHHRLLGPLRRAPPDEREEAFYRRQKNQVLVAAPTS